MAAQKKTDGKAGKKGSAPAPDAVYVRVIDTLYRDLILEEGKPYGKSGGYRYGDVLLLHEFAGHHGLKADVVERSVRRSGYFAMEEITIKHGAVFTKEARHKAIVEGTGRDLKKAIRSHPSFVASAASRSDRFLRRYRGTLDEEMEETLKGTVQFPMQLPYQHPAYGRDEILGESSGAAGGRSPPAGGGADDRTGGERSEGPMAEQAKEGSHGDGPGRVPVSARESAASLMRRKLPSMKSFTFSDGTVAAKLETWMRSLAAASDDAVRTMLFDGVMEDWLGKAGFTELEAAAGSLRRRLEAAGDSDARAVKPRLFRNFRESGFGEAMFAVGAEPLLAKLAGGKGGDTEALVEAVILLGGRKAVEPLMDELFSSEPATRKAVIEGLGELGDRRATPKLIKILEFSQDDADKLAALGSLTKLDDPRAAEAIEKASTGEGKVGERAKELLGDN